LLLPFLVLLALLSPHSVAVAMLEKRRLGNGLCVADALQLLNQCPNSHGKDAK
jgi:hypothetical protein